MQQLWREFLAFLEGLFYRIPLFSRSGYLEDQWDKYFSFAGFIIGLAFLGLLYAANKDKDDHPFKGMIQVLMMVAVINSCSAFWNMVCLRHPGADIYGAVLGIWNSRVFFQAENVFSGCLMTLALHTTYRGKKWAGAAFGLTTRLALILMNYPLFSWLDSQEGSLVMILVVSQSLLAFFLSAVIASRKRFSTAWLWYVAYQWIPLLAVSVIRLVGLSLEHKDFLLGLRLTISSVNPILPGLVPILTISGIILAVSIVLDINIRTVGGKRIP